MISECNPRYNLEGSQAARGKRKALVKTWDVSPARVGNVAISTGSSTRLGLADETVDYIFVDPPFGANIPYADLAILVESWIGVLTNTAEEAVMAHAARFVRTLTEYGELMERCFAKFQRVLKPGRWMTVEFSNSSNEVWLTIQHALAKAGFVVADTRIFDKEHLSYRQVTATNAVKRDLVISAYKPTSDLAERIGPSAGSPATAWAFVREHLRHLPVTVERDPSCELRVIRERLPDRLYDRMEAFHLSHNLAIPVTAAEFYEGLSQRFPQRDGMLFLDEQVEAYERHRMTIKDLKAAQLFITDEDSAIQWLRQFLTSRRSPQPYAAIQPDFFREVQAGLPDWEESPDLKVLLERSCLQDDDGSWYVPDPKKQADLEKLRKRELLKEFARYADGKGQLRHFSLAAVRAGFSDAWERRDFASIVTVGKRLPSEAFAQDERLLFYLDNAEQLERQALWAAKDLRPVPSMVWMPAHAGEFADYLERTGERLAVLFIVAMYTGMRRDELLGLIWSEVDLDQGAAFVRETASGDGPKSEAGTRVVPLSPTAVTALRAWRKVQVADRLAWGSDWPGADRVFTREDGTEVPGQWTSTRFEILAYRAGVPPVRFHDLRHGTASLLKAARSRHEDHLDDPRPCPERLHRPAVCLGLPGSRGSGSRRSGRARAPGGGRPSRTGRRCKVTATDALGVATAWPYRTPSLRTEASFPGLPNPSDLRFHVFESVRIRFQHVQRRTANAVWE